MTLSEELTWRGFVNQTTLKDIAELDTKKLTFYHGFDASADSQTVGNLAAMMFDKVLMRHGYKAILLAGGATSLIGDPGGKDKERVLQDEQTVAHNVRQAELQLKQVYAGHDFTLVNNLDWYKDMNVLHFLRDVGKHFSMTPLVQRDYIATRMGEGGAGISYTEFSYTLLQGYDFWHLYKKYGATLQLSGSDQWGNSLSGVDLIRRTEAVETHVMTCPLIINKATGRKFGKSEDGAVWLDEHKTSVYKFYQFWLNVDDEGVIDYLKIYTELDRAEIEQVVEQFLANKSQRLAQKTLAYEVTKIVHGKERAHSVRRITETLFGGGNYAMLNRTDFEILKDELPYQEGGKQPLADILIAGGLASSKSDARRFLEGNAVYINGSQIPLSKTSVEPEDAIGEYIIIRRGKNQQMLYKFVA